MTKLCVIAALLMTSVISYAQAPRTMSNAEGLAFFNGIFIGIAETCGADPTIVTEIEAKVVALTKARAKSEEEIATAERLHTEGRLKGRKERFPPNMAERCNPASATDYLRDLGARLDQSQNVR
jgi:hypothetical protein